MSITSAEDVIFIVQKMSMSYYAFMVRITLRCFLVRSVLQRSMAIKTEQDSSVKQCTMVPGNKTLSAFNVIYVLATSKPHTISFKKTFWQNI